jgi:hypothetical protein
MTIPETGNVIQHVQRAGYHILSIEHTRLGRWLFAVQCHHDAPILLLVQARSWIGSSDVQDLDEIVRVRRYSHGMLWAYDGRFTQAARRTCAELGAESLTLCTELPGA